MAIADQELEERLRVRECVAVGVRIHAEVTFENLSILRHVRDGVLYLELENMEGLFKAVKCEGAWPTVTLTLTRVEPATPPPKENIIFLYLAPKATQQP
ncbi:hypothetical protein HYW30_00195 [Candidatus Azambacteria bacterium]|nr:hypothetical protein [Candidatus Azambacteria bacterium]